MPLAITFLGTGGAFTDFRVNYHNNALVHTAVGPVLIDCGGTAVQALRELGVAPRAIVGVILTHLHGDHVGGLEQLVWERTYGAPEGPAPLPLWADPAVLSGARSVLEPMIGLFSLGPGAVRPDGWAALVRGQAWRGGAGSADDGAQTVAIGGVRFSLHQTPHVSDPGGGKPCFGVRARSADGAELYFTSDTELRADIGERFPSAGAIFHDTTFEPPFEGTVHTHYQALRALPDPVRARIVLMHYTAVPPGVDPVADGFAAAARRFETFQVGDRPVSLGVGPGAVPSSTSSPRR